MRFDPLGDQVRGALVGRDVARCVHQHRHVLVALGSTPETRAEAYRQLLHETLSEDDLKAIRTYLQQQRALGRGDFRAMVEAKTQRFAGVRPAHRPPRTFQTTVSEPDPVLDSDN